MWLWKANESPRSDCRDDFLSHCSYQPCRIALNLLGSTRKQKLTLNLITSCWLLLGHSQEEQIRCGSQVNPAESQDWQAGQLRSVALFGL